MSTGKALAGKAPVDYYSQGTRVPLAISYMMKEGYKIFDTQSMETATLGLSGSAF